MKKLFQILFHILLAYGLIAALTCSSVQEFVKENIQKPEVEFAGAKLQGLSFEQLDLLFDVRITNPNPVGVKLASFDYDFFVNENHFLGGKQEKGFEIASNGESTVQIPIALQFQEIYNTFTNLQSHDSTSYELKSGFTFDIPVLGEKNVTVSKAGAIPLLKLPKLSVESLQLNNLSLTGADLQLNLNLSNPNALTFILENIDYQLAINDRSWLNGESKKSLQVAANDRSRLSIPISLNFLQIGQSAYQILKNDQPVNYHFKGSFDLASSMPLLGKVTLPFDRSGQISVVRP